MTEPGSEQFSLRWNNFHSNLTSGFHELLQANEMVDVTLAVEGQLLQAHKLVLSICSPFFKQLFKKHLCTHPIIILNDVTYGNLKDILEFMYFGEVNIVRENLSTFLRTAELLQIKGLTGDDSSETSSKKDEKLDSTCDSEIEQDIQHFKQLMESDPTYSSSEFPLTSPAQTPTPPTNTKRQSKHSHTNSKRVKCESGQSNKTQAKPPDNLDVDGCNNSVPEEESEYIEVPGLKGDSTAYNSESEETKESLKHLLDLSSANAPANQELNSQDHGKLEPKNSRSHSYKCDKCVKSFSRRDHLRTHEKNIHGEDAGPFACYICSQLYKNSESLRKHIAKFHYQKQNDMQQKVQC